MTRVIEAGGPSEEEPASAAVQIWSAVHGCVLLEIAGFFGAGGASAERFLLPLVAKLAAGIGAAPEDAARLRPPGRRRWPKPELATERSRRARH